MILHQRDAFLENLKEFNGLLTYLPHVDMNSPVPVIKALDTLPGRKITQQQNLIKIRVCYDRRAISYLLQHPFSFKKKRIPEGFHGIIIAEFFAPKISRDTEVPFLLEGLP